MLFPAVSRNILVEMTCPYFANILSKSVSLKPGGRFAKYKLVGSCSCCCWFLFNKLNKKFHKTKKEKQQKFDKYVCSHENQKAKLLIPVINN